MVAFLSLLIQANDNNFIMKMSSTLANTNINFNFNTVYMGNEITLNVVSANDRFSVAVSDKLIGYIKIGDERHTWYVIDSKYTPAYLVNEIGNKIEAELYHASTRRVSA